MKAGWEKKRLEDLLDIQNGYACDSKLFSSSDGIPLIRIRDLKRGTQTETRYVGEYEDKYITEAGDLLIGMDGEFGCYEWKGKAALLNQRVCRLQNFRPDVLPRFLFYGLNSHLRSIEDATTFTTVKHLSSRQILDISFSLPPRPEQQRIVRILNEAFDAIATAKANAEKNFRNARALFESHLHAIFKSAWESCALVPLSQLATDITDGDHLPPPKSAVGVPFITIGNIMKDTRAIDFSETFLVTREYFERLKANRKPKLGDVLYTVTGSFGIPVIVEDHLEFCFQRHIALVRPNADTQSRWLYYLLLSPQVLKQANEGATGTAQKTVSLTVLRRLKVPRMPVDQQSCLTAKLDGFRIESQRLQSAYHQKVTALDELKKSLLHQAFTGAL